MRMLFLVHRIYTHKIITIIVEAEKRVGKNCPGRCKSNGREEKGKAKPRE